MAGRGEETGARRSLKPKPLGKMSIETGAWKGGRGEGTPETNCRSKGRCPRLLFLR